MDFEELKKKAHSLPYKPGVYIMMNKNGEVIYVGKAKKLHNRVSSYFNEGDKNTKTSVMVSKINDFDIIIANSEFEALVLESALIKRHKPRYNILLKDDKGYPFVRLDRSELYPKFSIVSKPQNDNAEYFAPFGGRNITKEAIDSIYKALKLPTCSKKFPRDIGKERPCLNYHMGLCDGYCTGKPDGSAYRSAIDEAAMVMRGKTDELCGILREEMERFAEEYKFEQAAEKRDRMRAIQSLGHKQRVLFKMSADTDIIGFFRGPAKSCFVVLKYEQGKLASKDMELIENPLEEDGEAVFDLVRQYYTLQGAYPKEIYLPENTADKDLLEDILSEAAGFRVKTFVPQKGEKKRLIDTAEMNAREEVERITTREEKVQSSLEWLQKALGLSEPIRRIEAYDISNTGSSDIVAAMTVFVNGRPLKNAYRKFKLKTVQGPNDYESMREIIARRIERYLINDEKFMPLPDLILVDGGAEHASAALKVLHEKKVVIPVYGMVKNERHRTRALVAPDGKEIGIATNQAVFVLIGNIQEETHKTAIEYHRTRRSKTSYHSSLEDIPGVGEKRRRDLLKAFRNIQSIEQATVEQLHEIVPQNVAENIYEYYHKKGVK